MQTLPLFFNLQDKRVLVVGGGAVATRKVQSLRKAGARVTVIATHISEALKAEQDAHLTLNETPYHPASIDSAWLVIAATNDAQVNQQVYHDCVSANIWVNVVDVPHLCTFTFPAIIDRSPITIAISSAGKAPVLARLWKERLEALIPNWTGKLADVAGEFRRHVQAALPDVMSRRHYWERIFRGPAIAHAEAGNWQGVQDELQRQLNSDQSDANANGQVYLVGAGPGDPDLLTIKALRTMQLADVIVYDQLVSPEIMSLCRKDADYIAVGKKASKHTLPQDQINQLLVTLAQQGKVVCRLKGGDPYIFGRGGEEAETLVENGIDYHVVPGITAAAACSASAGIPLTHRDFAQSIQFVTGHCKNDDGIAGVDTEQPDWKRMAQSNQTLVIYMGVIRSQIIKARLMKYGRSGMTPVAIIENGTRPNQRVVTGKLHELDTIAKRHNIGSPALIIVGEVVNLHDKLSQGLVDQWQGQQRLAS